MSRTQATRKRGRPPKSTVADNAATIYRALAREGISFDEVRIPRISRAEAEEIIAAYRAGTPWQHLTERFGLPASALNNLLVREGIDRDRLQQANQNVA